MMGVGPLTQYDWCPYEMGKLGHIHTHTLRRPREEMKADITVMQQKPGKAKGCQ